MVSDGYQRAERHHSMESGAVEYRCKLQTVQELVARVRVRLHENSRNDQLEAADQVVAALVQAVAAKDPATAEHLERLAALAEMLGQHLGWSGTELIALRQGAQLHDIGKIGVDTAILRKDGP